MALIKAGVPPDYVAQLSPARRTAFLIVCGEMAGGRFNWQSFKWEKHDIKIHFEIPKNLFHGAGLFLLERFMDNLESVYQTLYFGGH